MKYISIKGKLLLEEKLERIDREIILTYKLMGESTKVDNDLRENPEYLELQTRVSYKLPLEKNKIKDILVNSLLIEDQDFYKFFDGKTVIIGSEVKLLFNGLEEIFLIVGEGEEDPLNNIISYNCDFAISLLGKNLHDKFKYRDNAIEIIDVKLI